MATTARRITSTPTRSRARTLPTKPAAAKRHGCACLDLPRLHARGDVGCEHETSIRPTVISAAQIANAEARKAQAAAFTASIGTDQKELK